MEYKFTKDVEADFDKIAEGKETYVKILDDFWKGSLKKDLEEAGEKAEKVIEKV